MEFDKNLYSAINTMMNGKFTFGEPRKAFSNFVLSLDAKIVETWLLSYRFDVIGKYCQIVDLRTKVIEFSCPLDLHSCVFHALREFGFITDLCLEVYDMFNDSNK